MKTLELIGAIQLLVDGPPVLGSSQMGWAGVRFDLQAAKRALSDGRLEEGLRRCEGYMDIILDKIRNQKDLPLDGKFESVCRIFMEESGVD